MNEITKAEDNIIVPALSGAEALQVWGQYQDVIQKVCTDEDYQVIGTEKFRKKSGWRKIATFFNLSTEIVEERKEMIGDNTVYHFTVKALHKNGRFAVGTGSCDAYEKAVLKDGKYKSKGNVIKWGKRPNGKSYPLEWEWIDAVPNSIHNIRTTAETRATNRAISNLVGGGEVSAEEVDQQAHDVEEGEVVPPPAKTPVQPKPQAQEVKQEPLINDFQKTHIQAAYKSLNMSAEDIKKDLVERFGVEALEGLTLRQAGSYKTELEAKAKKGAAG